MMILSISQPAYLPWLGYFDRIAKSDCHVVLDHVQLERNSSNSTNRNKILLNDSPFTLTVPVVKKGLSNINEVSIDTSQKWQKKHSKSIESAYKKAPYYTQYAEELLGIIIEPQEKLINLLKPQLHFFLQALGIKTPIHYSSDFNWKHQKSDLILEICTHFNATTYISGPFGRDYLDESSFKDQGINIEYQDYVHPQYSQFKTPFVSHLSTLDLLMHHGKNSLDILQEKT